MIMSMKSILICVLFTAASPELLRSTDSVDFRASVKLIERVIDDHRITTATSNARHQKLSIVCAQSPDNSSDSAQVTNSRNLFAILGNLFRILKLLRNKIGNVLQSSTRGLIWRGDRKGNDTVSNHGPGSYDNSKLLGSPVSFFSRQMKDSMSSFSGALSKMTDNMNQTSSRHFNSLSKKFPRKNSLYSGSFVHPTSWGGVLVSEKEKNILNQLHEKRLAIDCVNGISSWLHKATAADLLRFLRAANGDPVAGWELILKHAKWRTTKYGADTIIKSRMFDNSVLHRELFWLGVNADNHPTLVIRTQAHDGADYCEDPKIFTSFMVLIIEKGIELYGVGSMNQVCVVLDRGNYVKKGVKKEYKTDMSVVPNLVNLFKHLYGTLADNYPELLVTAHVVPASWFFSLCYSITSTVMDAKNRGKFVMMKSEDVPIIMRRMFPPHMLPPHLGGHSESYGEAVEETTPKLGWKSSFWGNSKKNQ